MLFIFAEKGPKIVLIPSVLVTKWRALPGPVRALAPPLLVPVLCPLLLPVGPLLLPAAPVRSDMVEPPGVLLARLPLISHR